MYGSIPITKISSMWQCRALNTAQVRPEGSTEVRMEGRTGNGSYMWTRRPGPPHWPWIRIIPVCCMQPCGNTGAIPGPWNQADPNPVCTGPWMGATPGQNSARDCRKPSEKQGFRHPVGNQIACMRSWKPKGTRLACTARTMGVLHGNK